MTLSLKSRFAQPRIVLAPGVYDALTASLAEGAGFEAAYISGASIAYTRLGRPDIGLVSMAEVADTGYGNALNMQRTMRLFERAGANALQIEDQNFPKRCGHLADKGVIATAEMVGKIKAATDARASDETLVIARTDAIAVEGFDRALERAHAYAQAGADMLFVEAPGSADDLSRIVSELHGKLPLMANMVEGGRTPIKSAEELEAQGFSLVIFPGAIVRALARAAQDFYASLRANGTTDPFRHRMFDFDQLNAVIGTPQMIAAGRQYEAEQIVAAQMISAQDSKQAS